MTTMRQKSLLLLTRSYRSKELLLLTTFLSRQNQLLLLRIFLLGPPGWSPQTKPARWPKSLKLHHSEMRQDWRSFNSLLS